jgi:hypothetical protein
MQVASLTVGPDYNSHFESLFKFFMGQLQLVLPPGGQRVLVPSSYFGPSVTPARLCFVNQCFSHLCLASAGTDLVAAYRASTDDEQAFVQDLALFFTSFFRVCSQGRDTAS